MLIGFSKVYMRCYLILLIYFFHLEAVSSQNIKISVVTEDAYPIQYEKEGKILGPSTDLVKAVLKEAEIEYAINMVPWARAYNLALNQENTLIYSIARTPQREALFQWVGRVMKLDYFLIGLDTLEIEPPITLDKLKALRVGVIRNSATHQHLVSLGFKNLYIVHAASQSINMLNLNRIDLFTSNYSSFQMACVHMRVDCHRIKKIYPLEKLSTSLFFAFSHNTPSQLVEKVRAAYQRVMENHQPLYE